MKLIGVPELIVLIIILTIIYRIFFSKKMGEKIVNKLAQPKENLDEAIKIIQENILVVTTNTISGKTISKTLGAVSGNSSHYGSDCYGSAMIHFSAESAERQAMLCIMQKALEMGANAIIDLKITNSGVGVQTRVMYSGTAVITE